MQMATSNGVVSSSTGPNCPRYTRYLALLMAVVGMDNETSRTVEKLGRAERREFALKFAK